MNIPLVANIVLNHSPSGSPSNRSHRPQPYNNFSSVPLQRNSSKSGSMSGLPITSLDPLEQPDTDAFKVFVRVRPLSIKEFHTSTTGIVKKQDNMVFVFDPDLGMESPKRGGDRTYVFDNVFNESSRTSDIYNETLKPIMNNIAQGFNSTVLAYGMTGSGKTFTMFGDIYNSLGGINQYPGFVNLIVRDIFQMFATESQKGFEFTMKLSYIEIYNEQVRDLLSPTAENLMVLEDPTKGLVISSLSEFQINSEEQLLKLILTGNARRVMASTHANQFSSRSHAIIQLLVEKRNKVRDIHETYTQSKLCLVDLAGSERAATTENKGLRMTEGANINRSLLALGNCINILSDNNKKGAFVPYRDSKLTRLLKDSLGGNTRTVMIACVSPSVLAYEETINTLSYASRARRIKKKVVSNVKEVELHVSQYKLIIDTLKGEIEGLRSQLQDRNNDGKTVNIRGNEVNRIESSVDELGKNLLANLEENYEIRQNLKDLRELRAQNETNLLTKMEEQRKISDDPVSFEKAGKEIASLKEVMTYNEKLEVEMEASLEENLKEKKAIEDKIVNISSQWTKNSASSSSSLEKNLQDFVQSRNNSHRQAEGEREDLMAIQHRKIKDTKILELEKEIEIMRRQIIEKDKLIAQNELTRSTMQTIQTERRSMKSPLQSSRVYPSNPKKESQNDVYNLVMNRYQSKETNPKEADNRLQAGYSSKGTKKVSNSPLPKKGESPRKYPGVVHNVNELHHSPPATFRHTASKNQPGKSNELLSVEDLKSYQQILNNINFNSVQAKGNTPKSNIGHKSPKKIATKNGYYDSYNQRSGLGHTKTSASKEYDTKSSRNSTPAKDISKFSVASLIKNDSSKEAGAVEFHLLEDVSSLKTTVTTLQSSRAKRKQSQSMSYKPELPQANVTNFNLNMMVLLRDEENAKDMGIMDLVISPNTKRKSDDKEKAEQRGEEKPPVNIKDVGSFTFFSNKEVNMMSLEEKIRTELPGPMSKPKGFRPATGQNINNFKPKASDIHIQISREPSLTNRADPYSTNDQNSSISKDITSIPTSVIIKNLENVASSMTNTELGSPMKLLTPIPIFSNDPSPSHRQTGSEATSIQQLSPRKNPNDIRNLETARDIVRSFRLKLSDLSAIVDSNMLNDYYAQGIYNLVAEYNENKEYLSIKDYNLLMSLEKAANLYKFGESKGGSSTGTPKNVSLAIKDLASKLDPYSLYKKPVQLGDPLSPAKFPGPEGRTNSLSIEQAPHQDYKDLNNFIFNKPGAMKTSSIYGGNTTRNGSNKINLYSQGRRPNQDQDPYLGAGDQYEGMAVLQKSAEFSRGGSKRRTNPELQSLIEKQKKYHEDFDKAK